jgi:F0F1-type ATP synthase membrane subunit a
MRDLEMKAINSKLYHPYADRPSSPWEEWKVTLGLALVTFGQFMIIDVLKNGILHYFLKTIEYLLLSPIAIIGLLFEFLR